ncbi:MAG: ornithine cyclodeaminase family protein [Chloroflexota bacterium]|nr:ornithine cyclodeaminase family protein [Chloroflexota bacterium]
MAIYLTEEDVKTLLTMEVALDSTEAMFVAKGEGNATNKPRYRVPFPSGSLQVMSASLPPLGVTGTKIYTSVKMQTLFHLYLYSSETGELLSIIEANTLGQIRTGAATGIATKYLSRKDCVSVGVIGCGYQAKSQLVAVCQVRNIKEIRAFSRDETKRSAFAHDMTVTLDVNVEPVESGEQAVKDADILITITGSKSPVLEGEWIKAGSHINAAGGNHWMRRELDQTAVRKSEIKVVDDLEQAKIECGDLISLYERGAIRWEQVIELSHIVSGRLKGRQSQEQVTLFESQGIALEDIAVGVRLHQLAVEKGIGLSLPS